MPGVPEDRAHQLIRDCIENDDSSALRPLLPMLDPRHDVIQVHGLRVVGAPIGDDNFVHAMSGTNARLYARMLSKCVLCQTRLFTTTC